jgi:hypothetical protein
VPPVPPVAFAATVTLSPATFNVPPVPVAVAVPFPPAPPALTALLMTAPPLPPVAFAVTESARAPVSVIALVPAPPACAIVPPPPVPPAAFVVPLKLVLWSLFAVTSLKIRVEVGRPGLAARGGATIATAAAIRRLSERERAALGGSRHRVGQGARRTRPAIGAARPIAARTADLADNREGRIARRACCRVARHTTGASYMAGAEATAARAAGRAG